MTSPVFARIESERPSFLRRSHSSAVRRSCHTMAFAMGSLGIPWEETAKDALGRRVGLEAVDPLRLHEPLYDAHYQARLFSTLLNNRRRLATMMEQRKAE